MKKPTVSLDKKVNIKRDTPWHRIRCCQLHLGSCSPTEGLTHYPQKQEHIENICSFWLHCCSTLLLCNMKNRSGMDNTKSPTNKLTCCSFCCLLVCSYPSSFYFFTISFLSYCTLPHGSKANLTGGKEFEFRSTYLVY